MRELDIHHPLQALEKPYAVFSITRGREPHHFSEPRFQETFYQRDEAEGRCQWLESIGHIALLVDLRDALYQTPGVEE